MKLRGFTLIEILVTVAIIVTLAAFSVPMSIGFYNTQITKSTSDEIFSVLKKAQAYSLYRKNDESYGVAFDSDGDGDFYVLFNDSYSGARDDYSDVYDLQGITVEFDPILSPVDEVSFEKGTGMPSGTTTITLTKGGISQDISICESGLIELGSDCDNI